MDAVEGAKFVNSLKWMRYVNFLSGDIIPSGLLCQPCTYVSLTQLSIVTGILNIIKSFLVLRKKKRKGWNINRSFHLKYYAGLYWHANDKDKICIINFMRVTIMLVHSLKASPNDMRNLRLKFSIKYHTELLLLILQ